MCASVHAKADQAELPLQPGCEVEQIGTNMMLLPRAPYAIWKLINALEDTNDGDDENPESNENNV